MTDIQRERGNKKSSGKGEIEHKQELMKKVIILRNGWDAEKDSSNAGKKKCQKIKKRGKVDKPEKEKERWRSDCCDVMLSLMPRIRALYSVPGGREVGVVDGEAGGGGERWRREVREVEANGGEGCPDSREID